MDYEIRGIIQQYIVKYVNGGVLLDDLNMWNNSLHENDVDQKSALLGQVYGGALRLLANLNGVEEEELTPRDREELRDLFSVTVRGIGSAIENMLNNS